MKKLTLLFLVLICVGCGREAKDIRLKSTLFNPGINRGISTDFIYDEDLRAGTILAIPNESELVNVSFTAPDEWTPYLEAMKNDKGEPFFDKLPVLSFEKDENAFEKRKIITRIILLASEIRDDLYLKVAAGEREKRKIDEERLQAISEFTEKYKCYNPVVVGRNKNRCTINPTSPDDEFAVPQKCKNIKNWSYTDLTPKQIDDKQKDFEDCEVIEEPFSEDIKNIASDIQKIDNKRKFVKSFVTNTLKDIEKQNGLSYLFSSVSQEDKGGARSFLKLSADKMNIEDFMMHIDFGLGKTLYSINDTPEEGRDKSLLQKKGKLIVNDFQILQTPAVLDFTVSTEKNCFLFKTGGTLTEYGLRFIGDLHVMATDCVTEIRKGVVKLELSVE